MGYKYVVVFDDSAITKTPAIFDAFSGNCPPVVEDDWATIYQLFQRTCVRR